MSIKFWRKFIGYGWDVLVNKVKPGIPDSLSYEKAEIMFTILRL